LSAERKKKREAIEKAECKKANSDLVGKKKGKIGKEKKTRLVRSLSRKAAARGS